MRSSAEAFKLIRVSTGCGLARATFALLDNAASEIFNDGTFGYLKEVMSETAVHNIVDGVGTSKDKT